LNCIVLQNSAENEVHFKYLLCFSYNASFSTGSVVTSPYIVSNVVQVDQ